MSRSRIITLVLLALLVFAGRVLATSCIECENSGNGSCTCDTFSGRDPNAKPTPNGPFFYLKETKAGSVVATGPNPVASGDSADICWFLDKNTSTNSVDWVYRCTTKDYHLQDFVSSVLDSNDIRAAAFPADTLKFDEDHEVTSPLSGQYLVGVLTPWITSGDLPGLVCMPNLADINCDITNLWNFQRALGAIVQIDGSDATLTHSISGTTVATQNMTFYATKQYTRFNEFATVSSTTRNNRITKNVTRCLARHAYVRVLGSSGDNYTFTGGGTLHVGFAVNGVDTDLCTVASSSSVGECTGLGQEAAESADVAIYWFCSSCSDSTIVQLRLDVNCQ